MTYRFYRHDGGSLPEAGLPSGVTIRTWRPDRDGRPAAGPNRSENILWWALFCFGMFSRHGFTEINLWRHGRLLHRLIVSPRWFRFPFMAAEDLQIGNLWTAPEARGQGLARFAIVHAHGQFVKGQRVWYVVAEDNPASIGLIESCGYRCVGRGRRTAPLGIRALGRFCLDRC